MVSPPKFQNQKQKPAKDNKRANDLSHVRLQRGDKPLAGKSYYLDIKNYGLSSKLETKIKDLGGTVELFLVKSVTLVVSDRAGKCGDKGKWGYASGGSVEPPSLRSVEAQTPIQTPPTPSLSGECPLSNSTNTRLQTSHRTKSRVEAMLERALTQPQKCSVDPLDNALNWGIPIWNATIFQNWLEKIYASLKETSSLKCIRRNKSTNKDKVKVKEFDKCYIKFESFKRETRPVFSELPVWPSINPDGEPGSCPFDRRDKKNEEPRERIAFDKKAREKSSSKKDMTRRSRAARARRSEQLVAGYCEICRIDYRDLNKHVQSEKHLAFMKNDDNFLSLDSLINSGASVEAFLKLNQSQDVGKGLFSNGNNKLHEVVIENNKAEKTIKSELSDFGDLKMVQCNGAGRKLNLKLSSPHNLRTRTKHESGHLLRSKGSPWHEVDKSDKLYDKFDGFTIKKRAKGTIWIEEQDQEDGNEEEVEGDRREGKGQKDEGEAEEKEGTDQEDRRKDCRDDNDCGCQHHPVTTKYCVDNRNKDSKCSTMLEEKIPLSELNDGRIKTKECRLQNYNRTQLSKIDEKKLKRSTEKHESEGNMSTEEENCTLGSKIMTSNCRLSSTGIGGESTVGRIPHMNGSIKSVVSKLSNLINESQDTLNNKDEIKGADDGLDNDKQEDKCKIKQSKRGTRSMRTRQRLSVEERLIEDNRAYYKVEVLGCKLRSSTAHWSHTNPGGLPSKQIQRIDQARVNDNNGNIDDGGEEEGNVDVEKERQVVDKEEQPSSEKPVVVRFKRVRKSELSLLSDEAESFMFGDSRRDESTSDTNRTNEDDTSSSILPPETESEFDGQKSSSSSSNLISSPIKQETADDDSQDSIYMGRAKKRRRTQAEALIKDNTDYYKFETPGSRLRFQGSSTCSGKPEQLSSSIVDRVLDDDNQLGLPVSSPKCEPINDSNRAADNGNDNANNYEKLYPSKPSAEVEKMKFSFESIPKSEPWYQTYQRQDDGTEFWHYSSESEWRKPFLLPYEIENFHENLMKLYQKNEARKRNRNARGINGFGRSPRKSPRCHASTLAIMSTIIRKREQQQQSQSSLLNTDEDSSSRAATPKPDKSSTDQELQRMAKSIDDMLNAEDGLVDESFEIDPVTIYVEKPIIEEEKVSEEEISNKNQTNSMMIPGAPDNLIELLDNCHRRFNGLENSSCASSECGEIIIESPLKRRKRRKNRTGWPGNKIRRRLKIKPTRTRHVDTPESQTSARENECLHGDDNSEIATCENQEDEDEEGHDEEDEEEDSETGDCEHQEEEDEDEDEDEDEKTDVERCESEGTGVEQKQDDHQDREKNESQSTEYLEEDSTPNCVGDKTSSNDENHMNAYKKYNNRTAFMKQEVRSKLATRSRHRDLSQQSTRASSSENRHFHLEIESKNGAFRRKNPPTIISRKNYTSGSDLCTKPKEPEQLTESQLNNSCTDTTETDNSNSNSIGANRQRRICTNLRTGRKKCRKRQHHAPPPSTNLVSENNCCEKDCILECPLSKRMSSSSSNREQGQPRQRRSSIEFQPVVRVMKIEDQVDMDHSILSVTVASNRRLRSSSSPRAPSSKRYGRTRDPFGRWRKKS